jgi:hypothetical protein
MQNNQRVIDITDLLFQEKKSSLKELRKQQLYAQASEEAVKLVGSASPIRLLRKTEELYHRYLRELK